MFGPSHYVPVIKWKRGEQSALKDLSPLVRSRLTPLIELVQIPIDLDTGEQSKTLEEHASPAVDRLLEVWGTDDPFFLDCGDIVDDSTETGISGPAYVFDACEDRQLKFIPTVALTSPATEVNAALSHSERGICLRLNSSDLEDENLTTSIERFVIDNELSYDHVDVIIDLGSMEDQRPFALFVLAREFMALIPCLTEWRTLTLTASAFPRDMRAVPPKGTLRIPRAEWLAWKQLYRSRARLERLPSFGDYGIQHPAGVEDFDPRYMTPSATIRYTQGDEWVLIKGRSIKQHGGGQFRDLATKLVSSGDYWGQEHCSGCRLIHECHTGTKAAGTLEIWRRIGTNHHLTLVTQQLAELPFD